MSLLKRILKSINGTKAINTKILKGVRIGYRFIIITEGKTAAHINTISSEISWVLKGSERSGILISSWNQKDWKVVASKNAMVHIMNSNSRNYYNIETLFESADLIT
ncbi:iojap-like ribosome-associated protein [Candidatus Tremblaya phenacola PAVE]|nr:iojap-like ribosome-associated protein [Candidatus Tremblaya phenacola PAVE]